MLYPKPSVNHSYDAIVLGAGAAGLMCALQAGRRGRRVAVLDHAERIGKKILISGGGRCNFTNLHCGPDSFISANPHFCKSALARYTPADFLGMVEQHRIPYHEKTLGQLFCDRSARDILQMLESECAAAHVEIFPGMPVCEVRKADGFIVVAGEREFRAPVLVIATGGLSIPKMGATSFGYEVARKFQVRIRPCRPGLVPFTFSAEDRRDYADLAGISTEVIAGTDDSRFREKMLFTHRGLSGPAILQISSYWQPSAPIEIDLAPEQDLTSGLRDPGTPRDLAHARLAFRRVLSQRLADRWLELHTPQRWNNQGLSELEQQVHRWTLVPSGTEGYEKAEVTVGGVDTDELSARTMECRNVPGLYFIGEVVDVTGQLGGFNFQWAWASGFAAGTAL